MGGGREGQNTVQTGGKGKDSGRSLEGGQGGGGRTPNTKPPRDQSYRTSSLSKRTQCMRRNKATPDAIEEFHFLFEESVQEKTAEEGGWGGIDWWRLLRNSGTNRKPVRNAPCFCLLKGETALERRREERRRRNT